MPSASSLLGTYTPPVWSIGRRVFCRVRRQWCRVTSYTDAPISWPRGQPLKQRGGCGLVVNATLERAIRTESAAALGYHFGVSECVVWRWRKRFGIPRTGTPGSAALVTATAAKGGAAMKARGWTDEERDAKAERAKRLGLKPRQRWEMAGGWTDEELDQLGTDDDDVIAARIGRTARAVRCAREKRKVPRFRDRRRKGD